MVNSIYTCMFILYIEDQSVVIRLFSVEREGCQSYDTIDTGRLHCQIGSGCHRLSLPVKMEMVSLCETIVVVEK